MKDFLNNKQVRWTAKPNLEKTDLGLYHLKADTTELYTGTPTSQLGAFSLHPHIVFFENTLIASWSVHLTDEDSPGQYIRFAISKDFGETWSNPYDESAILFPPMEVPISNPDIKDADGNRICGHRPHDKCGSGIKSDISWMNDKCGFYHLMLCSNGFAVADGNLYAIAEVAKGVNGGIGRVARRVDVNGELGPVIWLNKNYPIITELNPYTINNDVYNNSEYNKKVAEKIIYYLTDSRHMPQWDMLPEGWPQRDGKTAHQWAEEFATTHKEGCGEPTYSYEAADGTYIRFWRNNEKVQHVHYSFDKGVSWTPIGNSEYPDTGARTSVGNLPDGSSYIIGNPGVKRMQLCLSVSKDGYTFERNSVLAYEPPLMKHQGRAKGTGFHYPHSTVADNFLFVIYSQNKEDIMVSKIQLDELRNMK